MRQVHHDEFLAIEGRTHTFFTDAHILGVTAKAFKIKVMNHKGAMSTNWVPKSKVVFTVTIDTLMHRVIEGRLQLNPRYGKEMNKYAIPKFFIR